MQIMGKWYNWKTLKTIIKYQLRESTRFVNKFSVYENVKYTEKEIIIIIGQLLLYREQANMSSKIKQKVKINYKY